MAKLFVQRDKNFAKGAWTPGCAQCLWRPSLERCSPLTHSTGSLKKTQHGAAGPQTPSPRPGEPVTILAAPPEHRTPSSGGWGGHALFRPNDELRAVAFWRPEISIAIVAVIVAHLKSVNAPCSSIVRLASPLDHNCGNHCTNDSLVPAIRNY